MWRVIDSRFLEIVLSCVSRWSFVFMCIGLARKGGLLLLAVVGGRVGFDLICQSV